MNLKVFADKIISIIFPEFTNKLTWFVVICGASLITTPLLELALQFFINQTFNLNITGNNDALFGSILIGLGLLHNYGFIREKNKHPTDTDEQAKKKRELEHDIKNFQKLDAFINYEILDDYVGCILDNHRYYSKSKSKEKLQYFYHHCNNIEFKFINTQVNKLREQMFTSFDEFQSFVSSNFFVIDNSYDDEGGCFRALYPDMNPDLMPSTENEKIYNSASESLNKLGFRVLECYSAYREKIKDEYAV